jgi:serine/threonine-protein kinase
MIGKKIQNYEIKSHLGEGGMGTVFRAGDSVLDREVALKMLHAPLLQQPLFLERFKKEARVLAQLLHPNIAVIYNMIEQDNNHFMVMEYVEGRNLEALLRQYQTLSYKVVVPVFVQALEGLHHAHKKGIYHRDIKPANLILTPDGTVKLMDFGIAMVKGEQRLTQVNRVVGTVEYIAPEIIQGKEPSIATDLYAVGVTMYEMLTGKLPFEGNTDYNLMQDILKKKPLSVDKLNASVPRALSNIVMKTLEKKPEDRFANAKELQQALMAAFPDLKFAELNNAYINEASQVVTHPTVVEKKFRTKPTTVATTGTGYATKAFSVFTGLKEKILARENRLVVISLSAVFLTVVLVLLFKSSGQLSSTKISSAQSDSTGNQTNTQQIVQQNQYENNSGSVSGNQPVNSNPVIIDTKLPEEEKEKKR